MAIVTDSKGVGEPKDPEKDLVFAMHKLFSDASTLKDIEIRYHEGKIGYKESKEILIENMKNFIAPLREKRKVIAENKEAVLEILKHGGQTAKHNASIKMEQIKRTVGLL